MSDTPEDGEQFETERLQRVLSDEAAIAEDALVEFDYENQTGVFRYKVIEKVYHDRTEKQIHLYDDYGHHHPFWRKMTEISDPEYPDQELIQAAEEALETASS